MAAALVPSMPSAIGWLAPIPLLLALRAARSALHASSLAFVAGIVFWALHVRWIASLDGVTSGNLGLSLIALAAVFSLFGALCWSGRRAPAGSRWLVCGSAWVVAEFARLHLGFAAMPWGSLAYSQIDATPVAQLASLGGIYGVLFVVVAGAYAIAEVLEALWLRRWPSGAARLEIAAPALLVIATVVWGAARVDPPEAAGTRVAFVQAGVYAPGVDAHSSRRTVLERYREQTLAAALEGAELVVWPASSVPGRIPFDTGLLHFLAGLAREIERPLLVGSSGQPKSSPKLRQKPTANSAFLIDARGEIVEHYDKIRLVPFNEYVPLRGAVDWPSWLSSGLMDAQAGERRTVFHAAGARFAVLICWENLFPGDFRTQVAEGVDFVVSMTNEAFTPDRGARHQMLSMNRFRAIEAGVPIVRAATTGVSTAIDRYGRMLASVTDASGEARDAIGHRVTTVPLRSAGTVYGRLGDWLPVACGLHLGALLWPRRARGSDPVTSSA